MKKVNSIPSLRTSSSFVLTVKPSQQQEEQQHQEDNTTQMAGPEDAPVAYLRTLLPPSMINRKRPHNIAFRRTIQPEHLDNYDMESVRAVRLNDIDALRSLHKQGKCFEACNRNGESLLHLACRRGNLEAVRFLIHEAGVPADVQDDMGRTVLHDVCWRPTPDLLLMEVLLAAVTPAFLLEVDVRGHTCWDYCRKHDWTVWVHFLQRHSGTIQQRAALMETICDDV